MLDGLDEALAGMTAGDSATFTTELAGGEQAGQGAEVQVTVNTVKVKELPELDDEFAQSASEFDTVGELRASTRKQMEEMRRTGQVGQARERLLDGLIERLDIPLPDSVVEAELEHRRHSLADQLDRIGMTMDAYLSASDKTSKQLEEEFTADARRSVKAGFILDKLATQEEVKVSTEQLSAVVTEQAYRMGMAPDQLAKQLSDNGQLSAVAADVLRGNALTLLAERATVVDEAGRPVEVTAITQAAAAEPDEADEADEAADGDEEGADEEGADEGS
jgi:trigger factor